MGSLSELGAWRYCCRTPLCLADCILHALHLNMRWLCNRHDDWITDNQERWMKVGGTCTATN